MRLRNGTVATVLVFITTFLSLSWYTAWQNGKEKLIAYQREFHALKERLRIAEHRTLQRSSELNAILEQFRRAVAETNGSKNAMNNFSDETLKLLKELTSRKSLQVPNIYYHLPHLLKNEGSLQPSVQVGLGRTGVSIVMGIPTVKRKVKSYLTETLHSLIDKLSPEEKLDCVMVVFIGETDLDYVNSVVASLEREFSTEINSGLVEVIAPPATYYPDLTNLKETFGDSKERVRWRTKQNLDYCFLMMYAQKKGVYYIQLEDDIVVKQNYFSTIKNFALQLASEDWMILEFSQLGFIGKMFQSPDITLIVEFIFMFYKEKPIDWLLDHILWVKVCNPEKDAKHCDRQKSNLRIRFRPSLFQHVGLHSSLAGKIQKLTDKDFLKPLLHKIHVNPPAEVSTSLKVYQGHTLEKTYVGEDFFWAVTPVAGDYILFKFDKPVNVERLSFVFLFIFRYLFHSGNPEHPGDILLNTTVEVLPFQSEELVLSKETKDKRLEDGYFRIGKFENGVAEGTVDPSLNPISSFRLSVIQNSAVWAILNEIHIKKITN
ncbi:alpha-1,3-mannosyl-glycoprotein 4-beta-N-acetylglucosaminyltransferase A isoform X1 [Haemorhous mexicanus]|uniref:alpha-1,3-mannosyl-glycoprotein 4-beta-N-acetylglucosaminyltransferase A isoform X1 n=1 Tax=Haemorhous mexicanus TaxID=30427 RepID=UPI0028BDE1E2|nr:alpha-1,3-mannosyl-glycoprotein 4-beta-N-acetylglucosaminyltransferase A isoform X1 [Haemorhous mexicanus]XP_059695469.1 alpha-1,3-mannosyl-glycoprotein 4-beta-N-acetylglucosaminyltransferase A isoform X1 [Haemorhous mexicanus]XP_059695470.1 alpha-1,3-mannosyl-glycoprotein 4-beta-N-acetylglucosaminyltransferase A isoform X1 [Haemorhous mexicanus]XP_059695471.1 alpha-1,3-mannosyl-glycoprotein 4-beta-N-acetylglucosaminyltransferase A isoform X1 [Haemorhous mexicanus]